jgi:protein involved in polysaccharide export with SLBB domain
MYKSRIQSCAPLLALVCASCAYPVMPPSEVNRVYREVIAKRHDTYLVKEGDTITLRLYDRAGDLNQVDVVVLPDGRADLFFMNNVRLAGRTLAEIEADIKKGMESQVRDTDLSIVVKPATDKVYMSGEFERPGSVDLTVDMTLHEAISAVGGLKVTGDTDYALLRRTYVNPQHPDMYRVDLNDVTEEIFLLPGDQIHLDRNACATVVHYIQVYVLGIFGAAPISYATFAASVF